MIQVQIFFVEKSKRDAALIGHHEYRKAGCMESPECVGRASHPDEIRDPMRVTMIDDQRIVPVQEDARFQWKARLSKD